MGHRRALSESERHAILVRGDELVTLITGCATPAEAAERMQDAREMLAVFDAATGLDETALLAELDRATDAEDDLTAFAVLQWGIQRWPSVRQRWIETHPSGAPLLVELAELADAIEP